MSIFDNMKDTLTSVGRDVSQKAQEVSGVAKLKLDIKTKEDYLNKLYIELGKTYYEMQKEAEMPGAQIAEISSTLNEIEDLKREVLTIQGARICPNCGATVSESTAFCCHCGSPLTK